ncbi:MAG: hypothetical protein E7632_10060 [Ruminococcaceae bacterium]|nr:hypothetical protein [Oscillospiraceae bacterium]
MSEIKFDFTAAKGKIKAMHAVGQPPMLHAYHGLFHYLTEANIPYSRLHDAGGSFGGCVYVDIPNVFPNFDADENDPASYDFAFTDHLLKGIKAANVEPYYRLGITIENYPEIKPYRLAPPTDFAKWARICEHVIRHYNEGWADGYEMGITYWEIWNEPDSYTGKKTPANGSMMWTGTKEQYFELYEIAAKHLKACFGDTIKVGGFASCGFYAVDAAPNALGLNIPDKEDREIPPAHAYFIDFFRGFLSHLKATGTPMDFFSWHTYASVENSLRHADYCALELERYGFTDCEVHCNEWNTAHTVDNRGTSFAAASAAAMMLAMQNKRMDVMCFYDARLGPSVYGGLFNPLTWKPLCTYYSFQAFGELYKLGTQAGCEISDAGLYGLAAMDGDSKAVMISNLGDEREINTNLCDSMKAYLIDEDHFMTEAELDPACFTLGKNQVVFFKNF